ncbi:MAG: hypothetical protein QGG64_21100 [Candidatus Latescibacteria bacterium]|nr:hypothetical protein [Candidatus Latescibacterota bacterium]
MYDGVDIKDTHSDRLEITIKPIQELIAVVVGASFSKLLFEIVTGSEPLSYAIAGIGALIGIYLTIKSKTVTMEFDRKTEHFSLQRGGHTQTLSFGDIARIRARYKTRRGPNSATDRAGNFRVYLVSLELKDGTVIEFDSKQWIRVDRLPMAEAIAEFLNLEVISWDFDKLGQIIHRVALMESHAQGLTGGKSQERFKELEEKYNKQIIEQVQNGASTEQVSEMLEQAEQKLLLAYTEERKGKP